MKILLAIGAMFFLGTSFAQTKTVNEDKIKKIHYKTISKEAQERKRLAVLKAKQRDSRKHVQPRNHKKAVLLKNAPLKMDK